MARLEYTHDGKKKSVDIDGISLEKVTATAVDDLRIDELGFLQRLSKAKRWLERFRHANEVKK